MTVILRLPLARVATLIALASLFVTLHAQAARPFVTDDARLTTAGSCQLESWIRICPESRESWAQPACNPGGKASYAGERATRDDVAQLKTLFRELSTNSWGIGLALGAIRHVVVTPGPNLVQVDATFGRQIGGPAAGRWMSFGLRLTPDRLF